jgi:hypothetical protein
MKTWVLILMLFTKPGGVPVGITSVPGYIHQGDCMKAGLFLQEVRTEAFVFTCTYGPP